MRPAAGQSPGNLVLAGQCCWKNSFPSLRAGPSGRAGMGDRRRWEAGTALVPAVVAAQRLLEPLHLWGPAHTEPGSHRARIVTCPAAPAGTPTSGHSACPHSAGAAGVAEQLVGGKVPFLPFWLLEKGALSSFRVLLLGLFSCLSSRGCCAIGLETKGAQKKKAN